MNHDERRLDETDVEGAISADDAPDQEFVEEELAFTEATPPQLEDSWTPEALEEATEGEAEAIEETSLHLGDDLVEAVLDEGPELTGFSDDETEFEMERHKGETG